MRPQARIALAIGAIILAGLVAFALMPRKPKTPAAETPSETLPLPGASSLPTSVPATEPQQTDAFAQPTSATLPTTEAAAPVPAASSGDRWDDAFHNGRLNAGGAAPEGAGAESAMPAAAARTYTVKSGDSFYSISQKVFGNTRQVSAIQKANPKVNPSHLRVGQVLQMPQVAAPATPGGAGSHGMTPAPATPGSSPASAHTYKVQAGDNLNKISVRFFGSTKMAQKIYELNRGVIGSSPSNLRAGTTLRLPEGASSTPR